MDNITVSKDATVYGNMYVAPEPNAPFPTNGLKGYWPFDGNATDASLNGNNGTAYGGVTYESGVYGNAVRFSAGHIKVLHSASLSFTNAMTIAFWMKAVVAPTSGSVQPISKWTGTADANYVMYFFSDRAVNFAAYEGGTSFNWGSPFFFYVDLNTWYHVAWVYNQTNGGLLYVNGQAPEGHWGGGVLATNSAPLYIGTNYSGYIDELRLYNRALSSDEVVTLYNNQTSTVGVGTISGRGVAVSNEIRQMSVNSTNFLMGKVGIGTNNPAEKLHVLGNVRVEGAIIGNGAQLTNISAGQFGGFSITNNLSEITNAAAKEAVRDNLGLGSAATNNTEDFDAAGAADTVFDTLINDYFLLHITDSDNPHHVDAYQTGTLSTNGGVVSGNIDVGGDLGVGGNLDVSGNIAVNGTVSLAPAGDIPMGIYTNQ